MYLDPGPLIGRTEELDRLRDAVGLDGRRGGIAILRGDAGIGKSWLLAALAEQCTTDGWTLAVGHCVGQAWSTTAYLPFTELLGELGQVLPDVVSQVRRSHPALGQLLDGSPSAVSSWPAEQQSDQAPRIPPGHQIDPGQVAAGVHAVLLEAARERPLLAIVEDVHWADTSSRDLLTMLLTRGFAAPVALVISYRSDDLHRRHPLNETLAQWARIPRAVRLDLSGLGDAEMSRLVWGLRNAPTSADAVADVVRRAEGNAFFAEELVASSLFGAALGDDLTRVLRSRLERLDTPAQEVVRAMAVGGRTVSHELLAEVVDLPTERLEEALREAFGHHLIEPRDPDGYAFRHALVGECAYDDLLPGERTRLHRSYAAALARRPELGPPSQLARHAEAIGDVAAAIEATVRAGNSALGVGGPADALAHFERALAWMDEDHPDRDQTTLRASAAASLCGEAVRAIDLLRDRLDHPGTRQDPVDRAVLLARLAFRSRAVDLPYDGVALTSEAMSLIGNVQDARTVRVLISHVQALTDEMRNAEATTAAEEAFALAQRLGLAHEQAELRAVLAQVVEAEQDAWAMERHLLALIRDLERTGDPLLIRAHHKLASLKYRLGDLPAALARYDEAARIAHELDRPWASWAMESRLMSAVISYELGDWEGASQRLRGRAVPTPFPAGGHDWPIPEHNGHALHQAAALLVAAGRGQPVHPHALDHLRPWWDIDGLVVVLSTAASIDLLAQAGSIEGAMTVTRAALETLDRCWSDRYQAFIRLAALLLGALAGAAPAADATLLAAMIDTADQLAARVRARVADDPDTVGPESDAWAARADAEWLRLRHAAAPGPPGPSACAALVEAWQAAVDAFERYGHRYEHARSQARLAAALVRAGDPDRAADQARKAHGFAERVGATPLLAELDALAPALPRQVDARPPGRAGAPPGPDRVGDAGAGPATDAGPSGSGGVTPAPTELTPREAQVLRLVAEGRTNGQIGRELFISTKTVSVHVSNVLAKLGAGTRGEAAAVARRRGLIVDGPG